MRVLQNVANKAALQNVARQVFIILSEDLVAGQIRDLLWGWQVLEQMKELCSGIRYASPELDRDIVAARALKSSVLGQ